MVLLGDVLNADTSHKFPHYFADRRGNITLAVKISTVQLRVTILGSGTSLGVPMIACPCQVCQSTNIKDKRLRASVLIQANGKNLVIDSGPDFRMQMLQSGITHLEGI